jgi:uncharacterized membrane protein
MKTSWKIELPQLLVIAAMFATAAWAWPQLPDRLPIHWNLEGNVDGWGNKFMGLLLLPVTVGGIYLLLLVLPRLDPLKQNYEQFRLAYSVLRLTFVFFMACLYATTIINAFGHQLNMTRIVFPLTGLLFIALGCVIHKIQPNWFVGVRTPWTLSSRLSWTKTHQLARWVFIFIGALFAIIAIAPNAWTLGTVLAISGFSLVGLLVYSYIVYRRDPQRTLTD